ncbi:MULTISPECIES: BMP family protein [Okeania]|uniref:BMP family ABC transporter substrate-binding protein n=1 Tax=Okeania hirsuta TaxID=1458930 RepID=A0A3N6PGU7_9CYAN|nr:MULTISPECIES: BMP family protein [Okeania]NET13184.1 BMP family ABC transporter substrate-binding protein [Okeania sp. SIO1H6]NES75277.1 BMP family ABC transporter substrate-binding protein [Okeania sp. SIO1H4]NES89558.1 BMP family ABC transporter substrate-binding protein [Okeania sp. SIO2B9]NET19184.1 BMP family ABC transporter substrate-binding protein [Okeania sp. SIO1H5]NET74956.1 BMP family ABC transporter substrate-binding protein [Okeania sp. SIO1F9]
MTKKLNRRSFISYSTATLITSLLLKACADSPSTMIRTENPSNDSIDNSETFKIAIALPGVITDGGWNQSGYEGVKKAAEILNGEMIYVENIAQPDQVETLSDFARKNYDLVVGHGGQFDAAIQQVASQFPDTFFLGVNGNIAGENYASVTTNYFQMGYLAGVIAGLMTKTNKVAYLTGLSFKGTNLQGKAFELGAKSVNDSVEVVISYTGDFNDIAKGKEAALALISTGVDVIYHLLDNAAPAVLKTAQEKGIYAVGNTTDQLDVAPKAVLTSAVQDVGGAIAYVANLVKNNQVKGEKYILGIENPDITKLGRFNDVLPEEVQQKVEEVQQQMLAGKLKFEDCTEGGRDKVCVKK